MTKRIFAGLLLLILLIASTLYFTGYDHVLTAIQKTWFIGQKGPSIDDYPLFDHRRVAAEAPQPHLLHRNYNRPVPAEINKWLEDNQTATFLVLHRDSLLSEIYFEPYQHDSYLNTFSMAKSMVSMLVGILLRDGLIADLNEPVSKYIPELAERDENEVTIRHLLEMTSGYGFDESYSNPLGYQAKVYYGNDLRKHTLEFGPAKPPGSEWYYAGGNTILLGMVIEAASGESLSNLFSTHIWQPIGAEADAWWTTDKPHGTERSSCCFYAHSRDLLRLGQLYLHRGNWKGRQIIPESYVNQSLSPVLVPDREGEPVKHYGYQWWLGEYNGEPFFQAQGMLGQYIIVVPGLELVIVRTGHQRGSSDRINHLPADGYKYIEIAQNLADER